MSIIPEFQIGVFNGWWFSLFYFSINISIPIFCSNRIRKKFNVAPQLKKNEKLLDDIVGIIYYAMLIYAIFVTIKFGTYWFWIGTLIFSISLIFYAMSIINFSKTPLNKPVTKGVYKYSRNPIYFLTFVTWLGVSIATKSWVIFTANLLLLILQHKTILAEEKWCVKEYGDAYIKYQNKVPRYFLFF